MRKLVEYEKKVVCVLRVVEQVAVEFDGEPFGTLNPCGAFIT